MIPQFAPSVETPFSFGYRASRQNNMIDESCPFMPWQSQCRDMLEELAIAHPANVTADV
jgi:hypothetical protein